MIYSRMIVHIRKPNQSDQLTKIRAFHHNLLPSTNWLEWNGMEWNGMEIEIYQRQRK